MKKLSVLGLVLGLSVVMLLSTGGVALADANNGEPVYIDPDGAGPLPEGWYEYCTQGSLDKQGSNWDMEEWHFVLNGWDTADTKPSPIYVVWWTESGEIIVPMGEFEIGKDLMSVAHYYTADGTGVQVKEAFVFLGDEHAGFDGNLVLSMPEAPVPELPPIGLLGIGLIGLGGYVVFKRRNSLLGNASHK